MVSLATSEVSQVSAVCILVPHPNPSRPDRTSVTIHNMMWRQEPRNSTVQHVDSGELLETQFSDRDSANLTPFNSFRGTDFPPPLFLSNQGGFLLMIVKHLKKKDVHPMSTQIQTWICLLDSWVILLSFLYKFNFPNLPISPGNSA